MNMVRSLRQSKILEVIQKKVIDTQEELAIILKEDGFNVTQATVSRDIKELGLTKILTESGSYKYVHIEGGDQKVSGKIINMFRESVISISYANNLIIVKAITGTAPAAALLIDKLSMPEVLGTIAGDDTFLIVATSNDGAEVVVAKLKEIAGI